MFTKMFPVLFLASALLALSTAPVAVVGSPGDASVLIVDAVNPARFDPEPAPKSADTPPSPMSEWNYANGKGRFALTGPGEWVEYQDGNEAFKFKESDRKDGEVVLVDDSRNITVRLTGSGAHVLRGEVELFIIRGMWAK